MGGRRPRARLAWQQKAAVGAYRELSGHDNPDDPIGLDPATGSPDLRAAWHQARAALDKAIRDQRRHAREHDTIGFQQSSRRGRERQPPGAAIAVAEASRPVRELAAQRHSAARLPDRQALPAATGTLRLGQAGPAIPLGTAQRLTAILQPPALEIPPSPWILERVADRDLEPEAAG